MGEKRTYWGHSVLVFVGGVSESVGTPRELDFSNSSQEDKKRREGEARKREKDVASSGLIWLEIIVPRDLHV